MKLFCNGCSFTEGFDLPDVACNWPSQLGNLSNMSVINYALGGSSNDRIFRTTLEYLNSHSKPALVVIGWTELTRAELSSQHGTYLRLTNRVCIPDTAELKENFFDIHKFWLMNLYNEYIAYRNYVNYILHLQNHFQSKQIAYRFFCAFGHNFINEFLNDSDLAFALADKSLQWRDRELYAPCKDIHTEYKYLVSLTKKIDLTNWITNNTDTMQSYLNKNSCDTDINGHFLAHGHNLWAQKINKQI